MLTGSWDILVPSRLGTKGAMESLGIIPELSR